MQEKQKKDAAASLGGKAVKQSAGELRLQKGLLANTLWQERRLGVVGFGEEEKGLIPLVLLQKHEGEGVNSEQIVEG